ncbi:50S ribosomal protein L32 [Patescibacteria group bacterium]|nr:50S ribosomal protein L32 [Patescibacteria group bacterium]MBU4142053.1 50S ribosomal protein L32 [Patescibacteria group bacterium]MBU4338163.1 50S ribosomal protein L32 [Patescibacteria group bacterium]MBU4580729.1 50S ribosomal protein L32 [Patescibacteria group bacterium]
MSTPKKRHTRGRTGARRSHHALGQIKLVKCEKCGTLILPHHMCATCGVYAGREVLKIVSKAEKAKAKADKHKKKNE